MTKLRTIAVVAAAMAALTACSADRAFDNTMGVAGFATKSVVKAGVGTAKLAGRGVNAAVGGDE